MARLVSILCLITCSLNSFAQTVNTENLNSLIGFCESTKADEILIYHNEKIITNWKREDFNGLQSNVSLSKCNTPYMNTASMLKSWAGLVVGILIDKGTVGSVNDPVCKYLPEWKEGCKNNITIKHLLTMTAGLSRRGPRGVLSKSDANRYVLSTQPETAPGIRFDYSNESVQLLGIVIERVTKKTADVVFYEELFKPLGMDSTTLSRDSAGNVIVFGGCTTTVNDALQVALLMQKKGMYGSKRIVSEKWITDSTTPHSLAPYYGYLWWIDKDAKHWNYAATGDLGQMTIIFPDLNLIFIRKQSCDLSPASVSMSWMGPKFIGLISGVVE